MYEREIKTISLDDSNITWKDVDIRAKNAGFSNRSQYVRYLCEKDIFLSKFSKYKDILLYITVLLGFALLTVLIVIGG